MGLWGRRGESVWVNVEWGAPGDGKWRWSDLNRCMRWRALSRLVCIQVEVEAKGIGKVAWGCGLGWGRLRRKHLTCRNPDDAPVELEKPRGEGAGGQRCDRKVHNDKDRKAPTTLGNHKVVESLARAVQDPGGGVGVGVGCRDNGKSGDGGWSREGPRFKFGHCYSLGCVPQKHFL